MSTASQKKKPGPKGVYSPKLIPRICELAALGMPQTLIAGAVGVRADTFSKWLASHDELREAFDAAKIRGATDRLEAIRDARDKNGNPVWQANAWILKVMYPKEFAQPENKVEVTTNTTTNVNVTILTRERLKQIQDRREVALRGAYGLN